MSDDRSTISDLDFQYIREFIRDSSAIVLDEDKKYLVESRLGPVVRSSNVSSVKELVHHLRTRPFGDLHRSVVDAMTTNETSFFRDKYPFDALRDHIIPALIAERKSQRSLNIWCGACSSGQEPHSIAMLLAEHFPELSGWKVRILGTDISSRMLERARAGIYSQLEVNRGLPARFLVKYFEKIDADWRLKPEIRNRTSFMPLNLHSDPAPAGKWDLIMLRNVLIYFDSQTKARILSVVRSAMQPDGYLVLGGAESTIAAGSAFRRVTLGRAGCYQLPGAETSLHYGT